MLFIACVVNLCCSWFGHADSGTEMGESKRRKEEEGHTQSFKHPMNYGFVVGLAHLDLDTNYLQLHHVRDDGALIIHKT